MKQLYMSAILIFIIVATLLLLPIFKEHDLHSVFIAIFTSAAFGLLIELSNLFRDYFRLGYLCGKYNRIKFYNRNKNVSGIGYNDETTQYEDQNVQKEIILKYKGQGEYQGYAFYPRGKKIFALTINQNNIFSGNGTYQYETKNNDSVTPDLGIFEFIVDRDKQRIYIEHENKLPSGNAKGIEIWERK